ncbi:MAG: phosphonate C-P lyase system protein PhnL [Rhodospirillaceae bacterium]|nr:phosphonate C-P lyase system protein PhnL [Rhodospirillaceae bacterium]MBT7758714.1 phosphonate C-P lyase system protein PhnL [Rhodospirillaceae bacterium]
MLRFARVSKTFVLHTQGAAQLPVLDGVDLSLLKGECVVLDGPSGTGKSTILRMAYGNYLCGAGEIQVFHEGVWLDIAKAAPREVLAMRHETMGYVSQFLNVVPRVSTLDVVSEPLRMHGMEVDLAKSRAMALLERLNIPEKLWSLSPVTFSGGEQQRVNIARGFIRDYPILLLDEPTASLDGANRMTVIALIREAMARGTAVLGIFHDAVTRDQVATRILDVDQFQQAT